MPGKPHPMGNECYVVACGTCARELRNAKYYGHWKTGSLLLRLCEDIFRTGKFVVLDSSFCASQAIIDLMKFGVHSSTLIKKKALAKARQRS